MKAITIFVLMLMLVTSISASDNTFKKFQLSYVVLDFVDVSQTLYGLSKRYKEANPLARWYIKSPPLTLAIHVALDFAIIKLSNTLYKRNEKLGVIVIIGLNLIKGYIVYQNLKTLTRI